MVKSQAPIGFVILSHRAPDQLLRLVTTLNRLYDDPPIACHHDFGQTPLARADFPANVRFVDQWIATSWAHWNVVEAFLRALDTLYAESDPDWFVLLSGADYPAAPAEQVLAELAATHADAFLDAHQIEPSQPPTTLRGDHNPSLWHLETAESRGLKRRFYLARQFWVPIIRRRPRWRLGRYTVRMTVPRRGLFSSRLGLWWGDHWFSGNRRVANVLRDPTADHLAIRRHLRWRPSPDEAYYQSVLCNTPGLVIDRDNKRFTEWNGGGAHPQTLTIADVPRVLASGAHFARKFEANSTALDAIDAALGISIDAVPTKCSQD